MSKKAAKATDDNKRIAWHSLAAFGVKMKVRSHWDDEHKNEVDILSCKDAPGKGLTAYSTVTLSDSPLYRNGKEFPVRIEIVGACSTRIKKFSHAISTAAFYVMKDRWFCRPGVVFETMLSMYDLSATMEHLYITAPSHWSTLNTTLELSTKKVTWLWAIPISDAESRFIAKHGDEKFELKLEKSGADVFDINRPSIV